MKMKVKNKSQLIFIVKEEKEEVEEGEKGAEMEKPSVSFFYFWNLKTPKHSFNRKA